MNEDIYIEIGKTLENIQNWENKFKLFTQKNNIEKSDDKRSLSNMNNFLLRNRYISNDENLLIKSIIEYRNFIIHKSFIDNKTEDEIIYKINEINSLINKSINIFNK